MFKAIANWFKGLFGKAEQQVTKDSQIVDSWNEWNRVVASTPTAKAEAVKQQDFPKVAEETVAPAKKTSTRKTSTKPAASKTSTKTSAKTPKTPAKPAQKSAPKSKPTKTTK